MRILFILALALVVFAAAQMLQVGDSVKPVKLKSQHDKQYTLVEDGMWIITWDKKTTGIANKYFEKNHMPKNVNLLVDVSQVPSGIFNLFVLPNMRYYTHAILLSYDELYNVTLPYKENSITLISVKDKNIDSISFVKSEKELKEALK
ncbi:hypothetical protein KJ877_01915 [bacterium]|nr:hypothetical protein [bacterium]MBU1989376.1 hypothetical protein [bacterium]